MKTTDDRLRVVIAITESSPLAALWNAAIHLLDESPGQLVALFIDDDRWQRAASLPFTREISRIGCAAADFTVQRAEQINKEAIIRTQRRIEQLASETDRALAFEVLPEPDQKRIQELVGNDQNVLIAPAFITARPGYSYLTRLDCRLLLVEAEEEKQQSQ